MVLNGEIHTAVYRRAVQPFRPARAAVSGPKYTSPSRRVDTLLFLVSRRRQLLHVMKVGSVGRCELCPRLAVVDRLENSLTADGVDIEIPFTSPGVEHVVLDGVLNERIHGNIHQQIALGLPTGTGVGRFPDAASDA